jgi:F0F1-type ATP synthase assembly protein I
MLDLLDDFLSALVVGALIGVPFILLLVLV